MKRLGMAWIGLVVVGMVGRPAAAQSPAGWYPIERSVYQTTTVHYGGQPTAYVPSATEYQTFSTQWEATSPMSFASSAPVSAGCGPVAGCTPRVGCPPVVTYVPVASRQVVPSVAYMPVVARYPAPLYTTYSPVAGGYPVPATAAGPKVWVHPKVYVEGQPIRNLLRAITP